MQPSVSLVKEVVALTENKKRTINTTTSRDLWQCTLVAYHWSPLYSSKDTFPSEEAHAKMSPYSWGHQAMELTDAEWNLWA